jgi:hypothetical protein
MKMLLTHIIVLPLLVPMSFCTILKYTEAATKDGDDITEGKQPLGNRLYRYEMVDNKLVNPKLLLDLPAMSGAVGNGDRIAIGPDNNVYVTIGDVGINGHNTKAQNILNGAEPDRTSGILRINQNVRWQIRVFSAINFL